MIKSIKCQTLNGGYVEKPLGEITFRPSVYAIIFNKKKTAVLLVPQWDGYDYPGGGVDIHESLEEAVKREVLEETGYKISCSSFFSATDSFFYHPVKDKAFHTISLFCVANVVGGKLSSNNLSQSEQNYAGAPEWIGIDKLTELKFINAVENNLLLINLALESFKI